jgi:REP element-mobilizing transposase RayT
MMKRSRHGRILHGKRPVTTSRPMHITIHTVEGAPSLRQPQAIALFRELVVEAQRRGVATIAFALQPTHIHWVVRPDSPAALHDALRYVFGQFARRFNRVVVRRGRLFVERAWSTCAKTVRQAWNVLGYVLRNSASSGRRPRPGQLDPYTDVDETTLNQDRFLRGLLGPGDGEAARALRWRLLHELSQQPLPYRPFATLLQPALPGL